MPDEDIYSNISVFRARDGHVLLHDPCYPLGNPPDQFFDLHDAVFRRLDPNEAIDVTLEVIGEKKEKACLLYLHWKYREASDYVKRKAAVVFPLTRSIPYDNKRTTTSAELDSKPNGKKARTGIRESAIREICTRKNIQQLVHFTHIDNLSHILHLGLVGRDQLKKSLKPTSFKINDANRIDGYPEAICLSISFPNYKMFYPLNQKSPADWVVLSVRPEILYELDCAFCYENAASNKVRYIPIGVRKHIRAFEGLFRDGYQVKRSDLNIPDSFPTNPQAEVLVFNQINPLYIEKVYFYNHQAKDNWFKNNPSVDPELLMVGKEYFSPRCDYRFWQE